MHKSSGTDTPAYALGHSDRELERLATQSRLVEPITRGFFRDAGVVTGMRVLDVGSGPGDVAMLAADMVGKTGEVIGADRSPAALETARARVKKRDLGNVTFREGDPSEMAFDLPFDAVVGRFVLLFNPNPAETLRKLARHLRPGGVMVFHEPDWQGVRSSPAVPTYDRCCKWIEEALRRSGSDMEMGTKLYAAFVDAGLPPPSMRLEVVIGGANNDGLLHWMADLAGALVAAMEQYGVATAAELGLETLVERMRQELVASGGVTMSPLQIGAWTRT
jgi:SAM-dependent methyltransferase